MNETALQILAQRFGNLAMRNPAKRLNEGKEETISHPYEFLAGNFPTYNDFHNYFVDLAPANVSAEAFAKELYEIYHDMRDLPVAVANMNRGAKPANMEKIFQSMRTINELTRKKFAQANTWLAQSYSTKH